MKTCLHMLLIAALIAALSGCYSVYHTTMREYGKPCDELLQRRVAEAQRTLDHASNRLAKAITVSEQFDSVPLKKRPRHTAAINVHVNKAELAAWNTKRRILAVRDRMNGDEIDPPLTEAKRQSLREAFAEMIETHADIDATVIELRSHAEALGDGTDEVQATRFTSAIGAMKQQARQAIERSQGASMRLRAILDALDEYEVVSVETAD